MENSSSDVSLSIFPNFVILWSSGNKSPFSSYGLTGLAQTSGRNNLLWEERFDYDLEYVDNYNFFYDLKLIFRTMIFKSSGNSSRDVSLNIFPNFVILWSSGNKSIEIEEKIVEESDSDNAIDSNIDNLEVVKNYPYLNEKGARKASLWTRFVKRTFDFCSSLSFLNRNQSALPKANCCDHLFAPIP